VFLNVRTTGSRDMRHCYVVSREPNASSAMALTRLRTTISLYGVAK